MRAGSSISRSWLGEPVATLLALAILGAAGATFVLWATVWGSGVSPDSVHYVTGAKGLLEGVGLTYPAGDGARQAITLWPPLYSMALAIPGIAGVDPANAARYLNGALLAINVVLIGAIVNRATNGSIIASLIAACLALSSPDIVAVHLWIWSEPLFIALTLGWFLLILGYLESGRAWSLAAAAVFAAMAFLTRYAGAAAIGASVVALLVSKNRELVRRRATEVGLFLLIALGPMAIWIGRNVSASGSAFNRDVKFHRLYSVHFLPALETASNWMFPGLASATVKSAVLAAALGLVAVLLAIFMGRILRDNHVKDEKGRLVRAVFLMVMYLGAYGVVIVLAKVFVDPAFPFNDRILSPALMGVIVLTVVIGQAVLARQAEGPTQLMPWQRWLLLPVGLVVLAQVTLGIMQSVSTARGANEGGLGYQSRSWRQSSLVAFVASLPDNDTVFSNADDGLYFGANHNSWRLPQPSGEAQGTIPAWVVTMSSQSGEGSSYVVYFDAITWRNTVKIEDMEPYFEVEPVLNAEEGEIVRVVPIR